MPDSLINIAPEPHVEPVAEESNLSHVESEPVKRDTKVTPRPRAAEAASGRVARADTAFILPADTAAKGDTTAVASGPPAMIMLPEDEGGKEGGLLSPSTDGSSWVILGLMAIFLFVCLKFRHSRRYMQILARDLTDTRRRDNMFDNTVRESSFLLLLNIMSLLSAGVLLYYTLGATGWLRASDTMDLDMGICISITLGYGVVMWCAYWITATVFFSAADARVWVRGYAAAQGLLGPVFFILALMAMFYHATTDVILWIAVVLFICFKIIYLAKGFKIFMNRISSIFLFFYYLCILEIIPIIGVYVGAGALCAVIN